MTNGSMALPRSETAIVSRLVLSYL